MGNSGNVRFVLFVAPEVVPFSKTGGLADVAFALPSALARMGLRVAVLSPLYRKVREGGFPLEPASGPFEVPVGAKRASARLHRSVLASSRVEFYFLEHDGFYDRPFLYGTSKGDYEDNAERYAFLCRGALEAAIALRFEPDAVHLNDWQTGPIAAYLRTLYARTPLGRARTVLTIHNLAYQGIFPSSAMDLLGLPREAFSVRGLEFYGQVSYLKAGLYFADRLVTVSRSYAEEIRTSDFGCGLEGVLNDRGDALTGIVNGIDYEEWDPAKDRFLPAPYAADHLSGKAACKRALQRELGLAEEPRRPLFGMVTRLASQKGIDLFAEGLEAMLETGAEICVLGSGEDQYEKRLREASELYPGRFALAVKFDNALAHRIYAGSDFFLMPSRYEPCGLSQLVSLKYGTLPVVRATGGLRDTVRDFESEEGGTGIVFDEYRTEALIEAVRRSVALYGDPARLDRVRAAGMAEDWSWRRSAEEYLALYEGR